MGPMNRLFAGRSLQQKLLWPVLLAGAGIMAVAVWGIYERAQRELEDALQSRAKLVASMVNYTAETVSRRGDLQRIVNAIGAEPDIVEIVVVGEDPLVVLASTNMSWLGKPITKLPEDCFGDDLNEVIRTKAVKGFFNRVERFYDYTAPLSVAQLEPTDQSSSYGAVMVHLDSRPQQQAIERYTAELSLGLLAGLGFLTAFGYSRVHTLVIRRLSAIANIVRQRPGNPHISWHEVLGGDEIGDLARTLSQSLSDLDLATLDLKNQKFALDQHSLVSVTDTRGTITYANERFCAVSGYSADELLGNTHRIVNSGFHPPEFFVDLWRTLAAGKVWRGQICNRAKSGGLYWVDSTIVPLPGVDAAPGAYISIRTDVTELRDAQMQAFSANRTKSEFLANMSHEMRTPLNGILGMTHLLFDTEITADQRDLLKDVDTSAASLLGIINDLLDISKIEAGKLELSPTDFDLGPLVSSALALLTPRANEKRIALHFEQASDVPHRVLGDEGRLRQVLLNLIGNAIKFCLDDGCVIIRVEVVSRDESSVSLRFSVADSGIGISADKLEEIFEPFSQVESSNSRNFGGAGLGLSICRRLVTLMGGTISVRSIPGVGSQFNFTVPFGCVQQRQTFEEVPPAARVPIQPLLSGAHRPQVLIVEDNLVNQKLAVKLLEKMGCAVTVANNGREAIDAIASAAIPFKIVFMDLQMPVMDGFEATAEIRRLEAGTGKHLAIVAMTANVMVGDEQACLDGGMDGYVPKPINRALLHEVLLRFLGNAGTSIDGEPRTSDLMVDTTSS